MGLKEPIAFAFLLLALTISASWLIYRMQPTPELPAVKVAIDLPFSTGASDTKIYEVTFCDLLRFPHFYDGKLIRTRAIFDNGIDWPSLKHDDCSGYESSISAVGPTDPHDKLIESRSPQKISLALARLLSDGLEGPLEVDVDVVGRFYASGRTGREFVILHEVEAKPIRKQWEFVHD